MIVGRFDKENLRFLPIPHRSIFVAISTATIDNILESAQLTLKGFMQPSPKLKFPSPILHIFHCAVLIFANFKKTRELVCLGDKSTPAIMPKTGILTIPTQV